MLLQLTSALVDRVVRWFERLLLPTYPNCGRDSGVLYDWVPPSLDMQLELPPGARQLVLEGSLRAEA